MISRAKAETDTKISQQQVSRLFARRQRQAAKVLGVSYKTVQRDVGQNGPNDGTKSRHARRPEVDTGTAPTPRPFA
jgi:predicted secreted protein